MKKIRYLKLSILLVFVLLFNTINVFGANNNETVINANVRYKQELDLNKYGGQDFANKHIKETSVEKQRELLKDRNEAIKRVNAVADILKESKQYNMKYTWGGNHPAKNSSVNTLPSIQGGMDCSGYIAYVFQMHGLKVNPRISNAAGFHAQLKRLVSASEKTSHPIRMHTGRNETENGWIYTFAYGSDPRIKHIGVSIGNKLNHARGGPKISKTIDITNVIGRTGGANFSIVDILQFCAYHPEIARQYGFELEPMMSPEQVRSEWSQVRKGNPGGEVSEGVFEENGDAGLSLAYQLFHLEFNFDEWFAYPIFKLIAPMIDYTIPLALGLLVLFIIFRIMYELLIFTFKGNNDFGMILSNFLEKFFSAMLLVGIIALYKDIIYKPFIDFVTNEFVDMTFGDQIAELTSSTIGKAPKGSLNAIYYVTVTPLARLIDMWQEKLNQFSDFADWLNTIRNLPELFALLMETVIILLLCIVTIYLGVRFVISIFLAQVVLIVSLAFGALVLALSYVPTLEGYTKNIINAVITAISQIIPAYVMLLVWVGYVVKLTDVENQISPSLAIFVALVLFVLGYVAFDVIRHTIKLLIRVILMLIELIATATENAR